MKISLITMHYVHNYGSVLQTFATQFLFKRAGYEIETVDYIRENCKKENKAAEYREKLKKRNIIWSFPIINSLILLRHKLQIHRLENIFGRFVREHIHLSKPYETADDLMNDPPIADIYCTGSDQMWNSIWNAGILPEYFLAYAPEGKKRVAFATSFGRTELDKNELEITKAFIQKYDAISVREKSALSLLEQMGYSSGVHILDPTLIMSADEWESQLDIPSQKGTRYVLIYGLNNNVELEKFALKIAKDNALRLINISRSPRAYFRPGKVVRFPRVEEFLSLIKNADYIVTDSFHGTIFSLNFGKQVFVFYPDRFSTRLQSILSLTGQEQRVVNDSNQDWQTIKPIDYSRVNDILENERKKALRFINEI